ARDERRRSLEKRKGALSHESLANANDSGMVDAEHDDGGASDGSLPKERGASPSEMLEPLVTPWMKEPYDLTGSRIDARDIRPLVGITTKTGDRAILKCCLSPSTIPSTTYGSRSLCKPRKSMPPTSLTIRWTGPMI